MAVMRAAHGDRYVRFVIKREDFTIPPIRRIGYFWYIRYWHKDTYDVTFHRNIDPNWKTMQIDMRF